MLDEVRPPLRLVHFVPKIIGIHSRMPSRALPELFKLTLQRSSVGLLTSCELHQSSSESAAFFFDLLVLAFAVLALGLAALATA